MLKRLLGLFALSVFFSVVTGVLLYQDYQKFLDTPLNIENGLVFTVDSGMTFTDINNKLNILNLTEDVGYFKILARHSGKANKIKTGEYQFSSGLKPNELLDVLVSGKVIQYSFTLLEGWQIGEMLQAVRTADLIEKTLPDDDSQEKLMAELGYTEKIAEGLFFPDTYNFPKDTTDKEFLQRAYQRLQDVLDEEWQSRAENLPYQTPYEALIMASIIEKETGLASERSTIAGVFVRRLNKNMKLQTDPTVIYAMGKQFNGNIRKKDLNIDSPYNTYRYKGLPPSPIALVGREAIHAALHPEAGKSFYFVAKGDGSHYFSENLNEHNRAVAKYQLNKRK
jgi:peptidoglycan lytic transglycosylase G